MKWLTWAVAALLVLVCGPVAGEPILPATAAAAQAALYLDAFNRDDDATYASYRQQHWPSGQESPEHHQSVRDQSGGFDLVKIVASSETTLTAILKGRFSENYVRFTIEVEPAPPYLIKSLVLAPVAPPADAPRPERVSRPALITLLRERLEAMPEFSGALLIAENGKPVFTTARGYADRDHQSANTMETEFSYASMGKMFTAVAIVQLAQAGKLRFDAPISDYLKDYPNQDFARSVTVHQLLTHTGGAGDFFGPVYYAHRSKLNDAKDYIALFGDRAPEFKPGTRWSYSNFGYILLGRIIEEVSGQSYADYVRDHILSPAGMTHTFVSAKPEGAPTALRYFRDLHGVHAVADFGLDRATPAGGGYSTVGDLLAFANALMAHRLLDAEHTALVTTGKVSAEPGSRYGYGFFDYLGEGARDVGHSGGAPGVNGDLRIVGDGRWTIVVLSNFGPPPRAMQLSHFAATRLSLAP